MFLVTNSRRPCTVKIGLKFLRHPDKEGVLSLPPLSPFPYPSSPSLPLLSQGVSILFFLQPPPSPHSTEDRYFRPAVRGSAALLWEHATPCNSRQCDPKNLCICNTGNLLLHYLRCNCNILDQLQCYSAADIATAFCQPRQFLFNN